MGRRGVASISPPVALSRGGNAGVLSGGGREGAHFAFSSPFLLPLSLMFPRVYIRGFGRHAQRTPSPPPPHPPPPLVSRVYVF
jgi:hypothetical protein